jgi:RHS repeat-associated protein
VPPSARGKHSLGSAETISTSSGQSFEQRFDPFGAPDPTNATITRAGYTGHAHDNDLGLIDMKGRVYDPLASRFTTADPIMQAPYWSQGMNRYAYVFNDPLNATDPSGFISMSDVVGGFVAAAHIGAFVLPAIANGSLPTLGAVGAPTIATSVTTMPGLLQGQAGSGPTVVAADTPAVQEGARGNPAKAAGPKNAGPDPTLCASGLFECDWEAGTMRMNILIPDAPVGPAPAAGQTASWWARVKNWLFGADVAPNFTRPLQAADFGPKATVQILEGTFTVQDKLATVAIRNIQGNLGNPVSAIKALKETARQAGAT